MSIVNIKPHHFSKLVGELRDVAKLYGHTQQLRERIAYALGKYVKPDHPHSTPAITVEALPCDVTLGPGMTIKKGVRVEILLLALQRRAEYEARRGGMTPKEREQAAATMVAAINHLTINRNASHEL